MNQAVGNPELARNPSLRAILLVAAALAFALPSANAEELIARGANWQYLDDGSDQGSAWRATDFDDSAWESGAAQLGFGDGDEVTELQSGHVTYYFRHAITIDSPDDVAGLALEILRDDGAVVYVNGTEVYRTNMPQGPISYDTLAASPVETDEYFEHEFEAGSLVAGKNVIAVEVHQSSLSSSDVSFDLALETTDFAPGAHEVVSLGSTWSYLDDGTDQGTAWREPDFDDAGWASGPAQLGFGEGDEATTIQRGAITFYFRHDFSADSAGVAGLAIKLQRDDGAIVYLNGTEIVRSNMPAGEVAYDTFAMNASDDGQNLHTYSVSADALADGSNVLAVEVHQVNLTSSDLSFDLSLAAPPGPAPAAAAHLAPMFPSAMDANRQGFVRVINHSAESGTVEVEAIDDMGMVVGPLSLEIDANETVHFNSQDLEEGNADKGLPTGTGVGSGDWRLELSSALDIEVLAYIRTVDGFLTSMHDLVPVGADGGHRVAIFNPGSNVNQVSQLRMTNPGDETAEVTITGTDDEGVQGGEATVSILPGASATLDADELETTARVDGLGDGTGKWQLTVSSDEPIRVMSLMALPLTGHLTNLSTVPANASAAGHTVPMFPAASDPLGQQGFVRVINHSTEAGEVSINAFDDTDRDYPTLTLSLNANQTAHFNSDDLEIGNEDKGLSGGTGAGEGAWRLVLSSDLDIEVLAYIRTPDGFLTAMHDVVPRENDRYRVAIFNPGSNIRQVSQLRLVNAGDATAQATIRGIDDHGDQSSGTVSVSIAPGTSLTLSAADLENGGAGIEGTLGDGAGKWQLVVESAQPLTVMSLLASPKHLTNLSTAPAME
ncbi:MAG: hypothetical protein OXG82_12010 [Gammaproteobacteria bacterium]|nr:hypothetical protein [Gammaproteobacteria bacterium]